MLQHAVSSEADEIVNEIRIDWMNLLKQIICGLDCLHNKYKVCGAAVAGHKPLFAAFFIQNKHTIYVMTYVTLMCINTCSFFSCKFTCILRQLIKAQPFVDLCTPSSATIAFSNLAAIYLANYSS